MKTPRKVKTSPSKTEVHLFLCPLIYDPDYEYSEAEIIELLQRYQSLWCYFARETGQKRCMIAVDFRSYEQQSGMMGICGLPEAAVEEMGQAANEAGLARAYRNSRVGKSILVGYNAATATGWLEMEWQLSAAQAGLYRQGKLE